MLNSRTCGNSCVSRPPTVQNNSCSALGYRELRGLVPTAKVPTYLNRVRQGVRDTRPGLLPTPDITPMRPGQTINDFDIAPGSSSRRGYGYGCSTPYDDVYATPYAPHMSLEYQRTPSTTSNENSVYSECALETPCSAARPSPHSFTEKAHISTIPRTQSRVNDDELIGSLLTLLIESEKTQQDCVSHRQTTPVDADLMASIAGFYLPSLNLANDTQ